MILENQRIKLEFNENTGAIEGLLNKNTGWQVIRNKKLSEGIRLLVPISRDIRPVTCLTGWDDREMVNQCITYGYVINFEPYNFKGTTADIPMTVEYAKAANQFRRIHKNFLWNGEFLYRKEADIEKISGGGSYIYGVYKNKDGKRAVVISNQNAKESQIFRINIKNSSSSFKAFAIDFAPSIKNNDTVTVPARSIVMISE